MRPAAIRSLLGVVVAAIASATPAHAAPARFHASLTPVRPGAATTVTLTFRLADGESAPAAALASVAMRLPAAIEAGLSTLGVATCTQLALELSGPRACPPDAIMGYGGALVRFAYGAQTLYEHLQITLYMAPATENTVVLLYASGTRPVIAHLVFPASLLGAEGPYGAELATTLPPISAIPGAPDPTLVSMRLQVGPTNLRYYKRVGHVTVAYRPQGFLIPDRCPRRGFPFAATFTYIGGARETVTSRVDCPRVRE